MANYGRSLVWVLGALLALPLYAQTLPGIFVSDQQATLSAERAGLLTELRVEPGSQVKKGDVLAKFDRSDLERDLAVNRAQRAFLQDEIEATKRLSKQGMANIADVNVLEKDEKIALAKILWLKDQVARGQLVAPFSGTVIDVAANAHEWLQPGQPLLRLVAKDRLTLVTSAPENIAVNFKIGQAFNVAVPAIGAQTKAKLSAVLPEVDVQSGTLSLRFELDKSAADLALYPGMKANLSTIELSANEQQPN